MFFLFTFSELPSVSLYFYYIKMRCYIGFGDCLVIFANTLTITDYSFTVVKSFMVLAPNCDDIYGTSPFKMFVLASIVTAF
jgi:hypothetical protein